MRSRRVVFVGLRTGGSLIHRVFPAWMDAVGRDARLEGLDLPADTTPGRYRALVRRLRDDADVLGAVITSHKLGVHAAARHLLAPADPYVDLLAEVNVIGRRDGELTAHARDPLAVERVLPSLLGPAVSEVLCFGAGGAGLALLVSLLFEAEGAHLRPLESALRRVVVTDVRAERLATARRLLDSLPRTTPHVRLAAAADNDVELARLAPGAFVINATGLGKDAPGSPVGSGARFPERAVVWDANYRGDLAFLRLARAQQGEGGLRVHDGWTYFLHGWTQALVPLLDLRLDSALFERLTALADGIREQE